MSVKRISALVLLTGMFVACQNAEVKTEKTDEKMKYPDTRKDTSVSEEYFGTSVADPYRWLENDTSAETGAWVKAQNEVTFGYLEQIPYRNAIKDRLTELWDYEKYSAPFKRGDYTYFYKNDGLQNQSVIYRQKGDDEEPVIFLDPNTFSEDGTTSLAGLSFTKDGSLAAYQISEGGSDWRKVIVINTETMEQVGDTLYDVKFSGLSWKGKDGFYYSSYDKPREGSQLSGITNQHKLYFHQLGTAQSDDQLVFGGQETPRRYIGGYVTEDQNFLVISASVSTTGNELYIKDLRKADADIINVVDNFDSDQYVLHTEGDKLYIKTNLDAPKGRVVTTTINDPSPATWEDVIPETENVLSVGTAGGKMFATYMVDATNRVYQYNLNGEMEREIELPGLGSAEVLVDAWRMRSYTTPSPAMCILQPSSSMILPVATQSFIRNRV